jgi:hypothetical protein
MDDPHGSRRVPRDGGENNLGPHLKELHSNDEICDCDFERETSSRHVYRPGRGSPLASRSAQCGLVRTGSRLTGRLDWSTKAACFEERWHDIFVVAVHGGGDIRFQVQSKTITRSFF